MQDTLTLRTLGPEDAAEYNRFFRAGVLAHPDTLRISATDIDRAPFTTDHGGESSTFLAYDSANGAWLGVGTVEREAGREKRRHIAWILRMYVASPAAGRGIGRALLRAAIARARTWEGVAKVNLTVAAHNAAALGLYQSEGFQIFSEEIDAFRDPTPRTELSLSLRL
jgi:GNAT superfamily N-acetyltransferase